MDLFTRAENGYNCEEVEKYIDLLKAEYKKLYEHAKSKDEENKKLVKICKALNEKVKNSEAGSAELKPAGDYAELFELIDKLSEKAASLR